jgi:Fic family protein
MRTYERTHPWINFTLDLRKASYKHWLLLGEASSKCAHISGVPLLPGVATELYKLYLTKGALATVAIEGNTLTEEEVSKHLEGKLDLPQSKAYLQQEVDNIIKACDSIADNLLDGKPKDLSVELIKFYNEMVLDGLKLDEGVTPGEIRKHSVGVWTYRGAPAEDCKYLLEKLCEWLKEFTPPSDDEKMIYGIIKAIICHVYLAWIHPFGDGNGRTARLLEFHILISCGVPDLSAQLLSNHYNMTRTDYYKQLDASHKSGGDIFPFILYAIIGFTDGLSEQINIIRSQQVHVHWKDYIHEKFSNKDGKAEVRRRRLIIDLSALLKPIPLAELRYISPRIAEAYAVLTDKTLNRDINALIKMGLAEKNKEGVRAKPETMFAFLAPSLR